MLTNPSNEFIQFINNASVPNVKKQIDEYIAIYDSCRTNSEFSPHTTHVFELYHVKFPQLLVHIWQKYESMEVDIQKILLSCRINKIFLHAKLMYEEYKFTLSYWKMVNVFASLAISDINQIKAHPFVYLPELKKLEYFLQDDNWFNFYDDFIENAKDSSAHMIQETPFEYDAILYTKNGELPLDSFVDTMVNHNIGLASLPINPGKVHGETFQQPYLFLIHDFLHWHTWAYLWSAIDEPEHKNMNYERERYVSLIRSLFSITKNQKDSKLYKNDISLLFLMVHELFPEEEKYPWHSDKFSQKYLDFLPNLANDTASNNNLNSLANCFDGIITKFINEANKTSEQTYLSEVINTCVRMNYNNWDTNNKIIYYIANYKKKSDESMSYYQFNGKLQFFNKLTKEIVLSSDMPLSLTIKNQNNNKFVFITLTNGPSNFENRYYSFFSYPAFIMNFYYDIIRVLQVAQYPIKMEFNENTKSIVCDIFINFVKGFYNRYSHHFS